MGYFDKLAEFGFMVVCRRNPLGSTTMFAVRPSDIDNSPHIVADVLLFLPEWRLVDFEGDDAAGGAKMLYEKLTCTGEYATWDERIGNAIGLPIGFEHRPAAERFEPVA